MKTDHIKEIKIDESGRLCIFPETENFSMIWRSATEVHWDDKGLFLFSPKPREWSYFDWYKHIMEVIQEAGCDLLLTDKTVWIDIPLTLKKQIENMQFFSEDKRIKRVPESISYAMTKLYDILLDENKIGVTAFEKADAPMGVVFGKINLVNIGSGYSFFKEYCSKNKIDVNDYPEDRVILTRDIPALHVFNSSGIEVKGLGCSVSGMDSDSFEICIEGIAYPFYENEFPHHVKTYNNMFNK